MYGHEYPILLAAASAIGGRRHGDAELISMVWRPSAVVRRGTPTHQGLIS